VLQALTRKTKDAHQLRRAQAILWLDEGQSAEDVADLLYISRLAIYKWVRQFQQRNDLDIQARVSEATRSGRPPTVRVAIDPLLIEVSKKNPQELGYGAKVWTAALLKQYLLKFHNLDVSEQSIRLAIKRISTTPDWKGKDYRFMFNHKPSR
jgi:transposase